MSESTLTLRELFNVDTKNLSARVEPGLDVYQAAQKARQEIANESRAIRWPWVRSAVAEESRDLLNLNVVDVLLDAWNKYMQIEEYGDQKKHTPEEKIFAPLANHTVKSKHHPCVKILLKGKEIGSIEFSLEFSLTLESFVLVIQNGKVMEIQTGSAKGEGSLALVETALWKQELTLVHFPGNISLGRGIPLRSEGAAASKTP
jgi:hypothetical protein